MINYLKNFKLTGLAILLLVFSTSCSSDDSDYDHKDTEIPITQEINFGIQKVYNNAFGNILVNQDNQSLYFFAADVTGESNCNGGCTGVWPPLIGELSEMEIASNLNLSDFGTITRNDGQKQITFKGWPLYYFSPEGDGVLEPRNKTEGDGIGGIFYVAKSDYSMFLGRQIVEGSAEEAKIYLVDDYGVTLYFTTGDEENISNCSDGCASVWPPFAAAENLVLPSSLSAEYFSFAQRDDELGPQLTLFGSPLYKFAQDNGVRGNVLGQAGGPDANFFVMEALSFFDDSIGNLNINKKVAQIDKVLD